MAIDSMTFRKTSHGAVYGCETCEVEFVHPRPTPEQTREFYALESYYTQGTSQTTHPTKPPFLSRLRTHIAWRMDRGNELVDVISRRLRRDGTVVDIGCGGGDLLNRLSERGYNTIGVERDPKAVSVRSSRVQVYQGSVEQMPKELKREAYDAVVFSHVLEHLVDPCSAIKNAAALLRQNGLLFCEVPNNESTIAKQSGLSWMHLDIPRHINFFSSKSLATAAERAGFRVCAVYFTGYCRYFADSYIKTEQEIFDHLPQAESSERNSQANAWLLLGKTMFRSPRKKYDSVGIVAEKL